MEQVFNNDNIDDLATITSIINEGMKLGDLISITFTSEDVKNKVSYYKNFKTYKDFIQQYTQDEYNKADKVNSIYLNENLEYNILIIDKLTKSIVLKTSDKEKTPQKENKKLKYELYMDDDACTYYEFSTGVFAKYDPNRELYFSLDKNNNWVINNNILPWIIGAEYDFVEVKKNSDMEKKI